MIRGIRYTSGWRFGSAAAFALAALIGIYSVVAPYRAQRAGAALLSLVQWGGGGTVTLAAGAGEELDLDLAERLGGRLREAEDLALEVTETSGSAASLERLRKGSASLALVLASAVQEDWGEVRALAAAGSRYVHVMVPSDSPIHTFRDLEGKKIGVGPVDGDAAVLAAAICDFFRFSAPPEMINDYGGDWERAFLDGRIEAAITVQGLNAGEVQALLAKGWYRLVPIAEAESIAQAVPGAMAVTLPNNLYGVDRELPRPEQGPFPALAFRAALVAREDAPGRTVHAVLTQLFSPELLSNAPLAGYTEAEGRPPDAWPLHPAAETFYRRHDPVTWRQMAAALQVAAGLAVASLAARALWRWRRQRRYASQRRAAQRQYDVLKTAGRALAKADLPEEMTAALRQISAVHHWADQSLRSRTASPELIAELSLATSARTLDALNLLTERRTAAYWPQVAAESEIAPEISEEVEPTPVESIFSYNSYSGDAPTVNIPPEEAESVSPGGATPVPPLGPEQAGGNPDDQLYLF
jgi:hypothetical protein